MKEKWIIKILCLLWLMFGAAAYAQNFEGTLVYRAEIEVLSGFEKLGIDKSMLISKMKGDGSWSDIIQISYSGGSYYSLMLSDVKAWSVYRPDSNKIYTFQQGSEFCTVTDASIDLETKLLKKAPEITLLDTAVNVFNQPCKVIRVKWQSGYYDYYYSKGFLPMEADLYKGHDYDGWYKFLSISQSLPVRIVKVTNGAMVITLTLKDVTTQKVASKLFNLPELTLLKESVFPLPNKVMMKIPNCP